MTIKFGQKYLLLIALCAFLWNQQANVLSQKIAIENSYQQKVSSAVSRMLGQEKFLVIVSIEFSSVGGTLKKSATPQSGTGPSVGYIPGLPTLPSNQGSQPSNNIRNQNRSGNDLDIGRVEVTIGMDETSIPGSIKQEIKYLVEKIIPQTKDCGDCIKIEAMQFQADKKNAKLGELEKKIEKLEADKRAADLANQNKTLEDLERQINEVATERDEERSLNHRRMQQLADQDSIRFITAMEQNRLRQEQMQLEKEQSEIKYEKMRENKDRFDSLIISEAMGMYKNIMQQKGDGSYDNEPLLGMQISADGSGRANAIIFFLLILIIIIIAFIALNKKPKTIYLKPKDPGTEKKDKADKGKSGKSKIFIAY